MCFLFRYTYHVVSDTTQQELSGIGISGPLCMAFHADLGNLSIPDIYAVFAGWHVEHPEIVDRPLPADERQEAQVVERLRSVLEHHECQEIQPMILSEFFGEPILAARAVRRQQEGLVLTDEHEFLWFPTGGSQRPLEAEHLIYLHRGRRLLRSFNDDWS
jgi:hypothetical protein